MIEKYHCELFIVEGVTAIIKNAKNRNFPNAWVSGKFPKYQQIFECGIFLRFWEFLK